MRRKTPGLAELGFALSFGVIGIACFTAAQTRQPYKLTQIQFCPRSANHPDVIADNVYELNRQREKNPPKNILGREKNTRPARVGDFDPDAQAIMDNKYCHKPRYVLAEEWERYGNFGSKIPFKGDAIARVRDVDIDNPNYVIYNGLGVASLWGVVGCLLFRVKKLQVRDYEFSQQEKSIAYSEYLEQSNYRNYSEYKSELDLSIAKEKRNQKHQYIREAEGLADTENEAINNRLQAETVLLQREAHHAQLKKAIAENLRDAAKAQHEQGKLGDKEEDKKDAELEEKAVAKQGNSIVEAVDGFGLDLEYIGAFPAPSIIRHRFKFNSKGKRIADLERLSEEIGLALALEHDPRIVRVRGEVVVEVPRNNREFPTIKDKIEEFLALKPKDKDSMLVMAGVNTDGKMLAMDMATPDACHAIGAGTTGSGKTQAVYAQIAGIISMYTPQEVKIAVYDGKNALVLPDEVKPWLWCETAKPRDGGNFIKLLMRENDYRTDIRTGYNCIAEYNKDNDNEFPHIFTIMDEYKVDKEAFEGEKSKPETHLMKNLASLARSQSIHLFPWDQEGKDENISNRVKANLPARLVLKLINNKCSTYMEVESAEKLLGMGDGIAKINGVEHRVQMPYCTIEALKEIAEKRCEELGLSPDGAEYKLLEEADPKDINDEDALAIFIGKMAQINANTDRIQNEFLTNFGRKASTEDLQMIAEAIKSYKG